MDQAFKRQGILTNPRYDQNRLGGALGGPIKKNKLFYYGLYEYNPLGQASTPAGGPRSRPPPRATPRWLRCPASRPPIWAS